MIDYPSIRPEVVEEYAPSQPLDRETQQRLTWWRERHELIHDHQMDRQSAGRLLYLRWLVDTGRLEAPNRVQHEQGHPGD